MSSFPNVFDTKCLSDKKIECSSTGFCNLELPNNDYFLKNNVKKNTDISNNNIDKLNANSLDHEKLNEVFPFNPSMTYKSCKKGIYQTPREILNDNILIEDPKSSHSWSNQRGYGHITIGTFDTCSNIHSKVHPYNRIAPLPMPYDGISDKSFSAWNTNKVSVERN